MSHIFVQVIWPTTKTHPSNRYWGKALDCNFGKRPLLCDRVGHSSNFTQVARLLLHSDTSKKRHVEKKHSESDKNRRQCKVLRTEHPLFDVNSAPKTRTLGGCRYLFRNAVILSILVDEKRYTLEGPLLFGQIICSYIPHITPWIIRVYAVCGRFFGKHEPAPHL